MASILESIASSFGPDIVSKLGPALGTDASAVGKGLGAIGPLLLNGMSNRASTPSGAESLLESLPKDGASPLGGLLSGLFGGGGAAASSLMGGSGLLSSLFGPGVNAVGASLSRALGFNVTPLLSLVAPAALGAVAKMVKDKGLDAAGLGPALASEKAAFFNDPKNAESAALVHAAVADGDKAATTIAAFGSDWSSVSTAPAAALMMVATADLSGPLGSIKEVQAANKALADAARSPQASSLLAAAFGGGLNPEMINKVRQQAPTKDSLLAVVQAGAAAVLAKSPADLRAYKSTILAVAKATAEAAKEGGFLGIGGTLVSKDEQAALDKLAAALA